MERRLEQYLQDISKALTELEQFIAGVSFEQYRSNALLCRAVEREFTIIGEAVRQMEHHFPEVGDHLQHARGITSFRNLIVHEYRHVDQSIVWDTAVNKTHELRSQIEKWLDEVR